MGTAMSVSTRPFGALGMPSTYTRSRNAQPTLLQILPSASIRPSLEKAAESSSRRLDDRPNRAGKTRKTQEIQLVVARSRRQQPGWGGRLGVPRLLARQDELADRRAGIFIPSSPELWRQAAVRREKPSPPMARSAMT
jgi:hypothetical protein